MIAAKANAAAVTASIHLGVAQKSLPRRCDTLAYYILDSAESHAHSLTNNTSHIRARLQL